MSYHSELVGVLSHWRNMSFNDLLVRHTMSVLANFRYLNQLKMNMLVYKVMAADIDMLLELELGPVLGILH